MSSFATINMKTPILSTDVGSTKSSTMVSISQKLETGPISLKVMVKSSEGGQSEEEQGQQTESATSRCTMGKKILDIILYRRPELVPSPGALRSFHSEMTRRLNKKSGTNCNTSCYTTISIPPNAIPHEISYDAMMAGQTYPVSGISNPSPSSCAYKYLGFAVLVIGDELGKIRSSHLGELLSS
jgi:hypothetical protein